MKGYTTMISLRKSCTCSLVWMAALFLTCGVAKATLLYSGDMTLVAGDPTQLGRLSRNGTSQDWSGQETFPGVFNPATSYHYTTLDLALGALEAPFTNYYIQISFDSTAATTFLSAYQDSYSPLDLATNWLGDPGSSGGFFGNPEFFQVIVPSSHDLILVLNETTTNGLGLGLPGNVMVEAFTDTAYTDLPPGSTPPEAGSTVPEPGTLQLLVCGMALLAAGRFWRGGTSAAARRLTPYPNLKRPTDDAQPSRPRERVVAVWGLDSAVVPMMTPGWERV